LERQRIYDEKKGIKVGNVLPKESEGDISPLFVYRNQRELFSIREFIEYG
jgi:hypothetical protein